MELFCDRRNGLYEANEISIRSEEIIHVHLGVRTGLKDDDKVTRKGKSKERRGLGG